MPASSPKGHGAKRSPATPDVMTIDDLAVYLQISKSSLYKLAQDGKVPGQKVGKHWRFHKDAINRWLEGNANELSSSSLRKRRRRI